MTVSITRSEHTPADLRREAGRTADARASRRMLALALVMEGESRETAARSGHGGPVDAELCAGGRDRGTSPSRARPERRPPRDGRQRRGGGSNERRRTGIMESVIADATIRVDASVDGVALGRVLAALVVSSKSPKCPARRSIACGTSSSCRPAVSRGRG